MSAWITPQWPAPGVVRALVTTRSGGVSTGAYSSLNLALHVGDDPRRVAENRARLTEAIGARPVWLDQVHGSHVIAADRAAPGATADAAVTREPGVVCAVLTADCLSVLMCDADGTVVGVAHAGWRGLAAGVVEQTVGAMRVPAERLLAYLGPAIGPASFEVGEDVLRAFTRHAIEAAEAFRPRAAGKWTCDLYALARQRLSALGVRAIFGGGYDTVQEGERFYSYRRDGATGRNASMIWLAPRD